MNNKKRFISGNWCVLVAITLLTIGFMAQASTKPDGLKQDTAQLQDIYRTAGAYENGIDYPKDYVKSFSLYLMAAEMNYPIAMHTVGEAYRYGKLNVEVNPEEAYVWFAKCALLGSVDCAYELGVMYRQGVFVKADRLMSDALFRFVKSTRSHESYKKIDQVLSVNNANNNPVGLVRFFSLHVEKYLIESDRKKYNLSCNMSDCVDLYN